MSKVLPALKQVLEYGKNLALPAKALAAATVIAPVVLGLTGSNFPPQTLAGWLALMGGACAGLDKILSGTSSPTPTPPAPPASPEKPVPAVVPQDPKK